MLMNSSHVSFQLSEVRFDEYDFAVVARSRICRYDDKQNGEIVPTKWAEAGKEI